ncbi:MAG: hypothetical protein AAGC77_01090 [Pseudomonadota bacterium]
MAQKLCLVRRATYTRAPFDGSARAAASHAAEAHEEKMFGNGLANIVAAAILALAIVWNGAQNRQTGLDEDGFAERQARAVGDIRNDIVISCGCCGDESAGRTAKVPF